MKINSTHGIGVLLYKKFKSEKEFKKEMERFDRTAEIKTSLEDDENMLLHANNAKNWFGDYDLKNNNCADFVQKVARTAGIEGMGGFYPNGIFDRVKDREVPLQLEKYNDNAPDWRKNYDKNIDKMGWGPREIQIDYDKEHERQKKEER